MPLLFHNFLTNITSSFKGRNFAWHIVAIAITFICVVSGLDAFYFESTRSDTLQSILFPAIPLGAIFPLLLPLILVLAGYLLKNKHARIVGWAIGQAALVGWIISSAYKAVTGRVPPVLHNVVNDVSSHFQLGFLRGGIFWGWPSSHTTVAFALATALIVLFPKSKLIKCSALLYALYVGISVSTNIHWFSDFLAGVIIGSVVGVVVGKSFLGVMKK